MKALLSLACLLFVFAITLPAADTSTAQDQQVAAAIKEIQAQQAQMADNQTKIEAKLSDIVEAVRVARIYSSRGGR